MSNYPTGAMHDARAPYNAPQLEQQNMTRPDDLIVTPTQGPDGARVPAPEQVKRPMPAATLTALQGSIKKWERIVAGIGNDNGSRNCPLCALFINEEGPPPDDEEDYDNWQQQCYGCPVNAATGKIGCDGTPYLDWSVAFAVTDLIPHWAVTPAHKSLAQAELDFLRTLLPSPDGQATAPSRQPQSDQTPNAVDHWLQTR